ncbi:hypothetical protein LTR78_003830 [Recurvomyces mirabilis]|uniref:Methyltransferase domain-containing protein n=1 Tax=Recurvomyces mirabilis TaxID=574656 RepID=A0AAE0WR92_9PEZI|nr:hypothetical protein LTR78_003830 [Recurvomyces mirabilis]KAK5154942.1 hypothetical protein LTS14_006523 [Recurvomyces mirabilis]
MASTTSRHQVQDAQKLYDDRAAHYDDSWHPLFAHHMVQLADLKPGDHVLDLASGTGLVTFAASMAVGQTGSVTGVDISSGMLQQARSRLENHDLENVEFHQHSITDLDTLSVLRGKEFDAIMCASVLVLLQNPGQAIKAWAVYLKAGGKFITDVTHPASQISLITFERVGRGLNRPLPFYRVPFQKPEDLQLLMEQAGLRDNHIVSLSQLEAANAGEGIMAYMTDPAHPRLDKLYTIEDADDVFDKHIDHWAAELLSRPEIKNEARKIFKEEWARLANEEGKIEEMDCVFVGIGTKVG